MTGRHVGEVRGHEDQDQAPPHRAEQAAEPADDRGGEQPDRQGERVGARGDDPGDHGEQHPAEPGAGGAHHERENLQPGHVQAGQRGRDLVVAHRPPGPADPAAAEVGQQHQGDQGTGAGHPRQPAGGRERGAEEGRSGDAGAQALVAAEHPRVLVGQRGQRDRQHQRGPGQVRAAQPGRGDTEDRTAHGGDHGGGEEHELERPVQVQHQQRTAITADRHERAVADRDLAAQPEQHGQPGDRGDVRGDLGHLVVPVAAELDGHPGKDQGDDDRDRQVAQQGHGHTLRAAAAENRPVGRTIRTRASTTRPYTRTRSLPR